MILIRVHDITNFASELRGGDFVKLPNLVEKLKISIKDGSIFRDAGSDRCGVQDAAEENGREVQNETKFDDLRDSSGASEQAETRTTPSELPTAEATSSKQVLLEETSRECASEEFEYVERDTLQTLVNKPRTMLWKCKHCHGHRHLHT